MCLIFYNNNCFLFINLFWLFLGACEISVPWLGIEPIPPAVETGVPATGLPVSSPESHHLIWIFRETNVDFCLSLWVPARCQGSQFVVALVPELQLQLHLSSPFPTSCPANVRASASHDNSAGPYPFIVGHIPVGQVSRSVVSDSLRPHEWQHARPPCPSPSPRVYPNPCPLSWWCHPAISSSVVPFSSCPQIFPRIRVFSNVSALCIKWPKYWSFSFNISPSNEHPVLISFRMDWLDLLTVQGTLKSLLQHHSSKASVLWCSAFFIVQLSHPYMTTGKTIALTRQSNFSAFKYAIQVGHNFPSKE